MNERKKRKKFPSGHLKKVNACITIVNVFSFSVYLWVGSVFRILIRDKKFVAKYIVYLSDYARIFFFFLIEYMDIFHNDN